MEIFKNSILNNSNIIRALIESKINYNKSMNESKQNEPIQNKSLYNKFVYTKAQEIEFYTKNIKQENEEQLIVIDYFVKYIEDNMQKIDDDFSSDEEIYNTPYNIVYFMVNITKMQPYVIFIGYYYLKKILDNEKPIKLNKYNIFQLIVGCMLISYKILEDKIYDNRYIAESLRNNMQCDINLRYINDIEREITTYLKFDFTVDKNEFEEFRTNYLK